ncbi:SgcJ/EcaC family oxidoreductase [Pararhodonellum marinum]|uniref:SgcJ/EcaC family oxidoreductase n=1 Tax=Pararhodonellum marinum TaxID=2755358 RepID=UPI0018901FD7|nr:SgcJ/EcaC family oxidoreductase [Pararhodonellum marinum]
MKMLLLFSVLNLIFNFAGAQSLSDKEEVKNVIVAFQDDFNEGAFRNAHSYSTVDWVHINPGGGITKGREEVLMEVQEVHQRILKGVTMTIDRMDIRFVAPTVAVAVVIHLISPFELPIGVLNENQRNTKTYIIVKQNDKWLLAHDHNTVVQDN